MRAAVLTDAETIDFVERDRPTPGPNEVSVRIQEVGICGSDVHYFEHGRIGDFVVENPLVLGHEAAGEVVAVGDNVTDFMPGEAVAIEPGVPCRRCTDCSTGQYHLCRDIRFMATPPDDGAFVEYVAWPADFVYPLPDGVTMREGALCEPLSVGLHATELANVDPGDSALITGAGPIGLIALSVLRAAGVTDIVVTDVVDEKLTRARRRGARAAVNVDHESASDAVEAVAGQQGVDIVIEASGAPGVHQTAVDAVAPGGTVVCVGLVGTDQVPIDVVDLTTREITLQGSFRYSNTYPDAISLLAADDVDLMDLVDADYSLGEIDRAFDRAREPEVVKVMISIGA